MANHASARKRVRRNSRRAAINGARRSRLRTFIKKVRHAIADGNVKAAEALMPQTQAELYRAADKGVMKKNTAARTLSRLSSAIKALKN